MQKFIQKNKKILIVSVGFIFVLLFLVAYLGSRDKANLRTSLPQEVKNQESEKEIRFIATEKSTVYEMMGGLRREEKINFSEKTYAGMGKFIEEINGTKNTGSKNWIYYVNDKKAMVGVSNYKINPGDVVSWKYEDNY